jgi:hypothetical protein
VDRFGRFLRVTCARARSRLLVALVRAGLPPVVQFVINDEHGFALARADLANPDAKIAVEYPSGWI